MRRRLLRWFDRSARDLPWRRTRDPYAVWVSEVMLQQTRVETVVPYYESFLARFPTPAALAQAPEDDVMAAWSGLGYYRRARMLHAGAREVVARYGGEVPKGAEERRSLPGVGRYTAGAIGSIAFGLPEPVVDGNVTRVLCRLHGIDSPTDSAATTRRLWSLAAELVRGPRPGDLNQALMELGARVCVPRSPRCDRCPVSGDCVAHRDGTASRLPVSGARTAPRPVRVVAVVARRSGRVALARTEGSLFGGLWAVPMVEGRGRDAARAALRDAAVTGRLPGQPSAQLVHVLSHRRLDVEVWRATGAGIGRRSAARLVAPADLARLGVSQLTRRLLSATEAPRLTRRGRPG